MFKKALLSSLVSVFLALSIFTVATAFGATTPSSTPPNGLASPTFGGVTVNGPSTFTGEMNVRDAFNVGESAGESKITIGNRNGGNATTDIYGGLSFQGGVLYKGIYGALYLTSPDSLTVGVGGSVGSLSLGFLIDRSTGRINVNGPLSGAAARDLQISGAADVSTNLDIHGYLENSSPDSMLEIFDPEGLLVRGPTTISGGLTANSIGSFRQVSSANAFIDYSTKTATINANCNNTGEIAVGCGFYANSRYISTYISRPISNSSCSISGVYNGTTALANPNITYYISARAVCFDPNPND